MNEHEEAQYRAIRNRCWPQWRKVRAAKSETVRETLYAGMVIEIADVLGVDVTAHELDPGPSSPPRVFVNSDAVRAGLVRLANDLNATRKADWVLRA